MFFLRNSKAVVLFVAPQDTVLNSFKKKLKDLRLFLEMIKFEHTIFALPFAYTGAFLAGRGEVSWVKLFLIMVAMTTARTAGMGLNRLIDKEIDFANPRTATRALPAGLLGSRTVWKMVAVSLMIFIASCAALNKLCLLLSPVALFILFLYSYLKRYTWLCHFGLGLLLACAPIGGWIAVAGHFSWIPIVLGSAMIFWLAGFDILYACLDVDFDRKFGIHSIPERFGITKALWLSAFFHLITFIFLAMTGILAGLGWPYHIGLILIGLLLIYEHLLVTPGDLSRINRAFFQANAVISLLVFVATLTSLWVGF